MAEGEYAVYINLPDTVAALHDRPEYSVRFANRGVWEDSTGYNRLNHTLQVHPSASVRWWGADALQSRTQVQHPRTAFDLRGRRLSGPARARGLPAGVYLLQATTHSGAKLVAEARMLLAVCRPSPTSLPSRAVRGSHE
jgi:hypothetical protein